MADPLLLQAAAAVSTLAGFGWLALAMDTHWEQAHAGAVPSPAVARRLRVLGSIALLVSLGLCLAADHPTMAVLVWFMLLAGSAVTIAMTLSWQPHWLRRLWPAGSTPAAG